MQQCQQDKSTENEEAAGTDKIVCVLETLSSLANLKDSYLTMLKIKRKAFENSIHAPYAMPS